MRSSSAASTHSLIDSPSFLLLVKLTHSLLEKPAGLARAVANILWAAARLQNRASSQLATLWTSVASAAKTTAHDMNQQAVANSIWAVAKLARLSAESDALLSALPALASRIPAVKSDMNAQAVSNVLWAVAKLVTNDIAKI